MEKKSIGYVKKKKKRWQLRVKIIEVMKEKKNVGYTQKNQKVSYV